MTDETPALLPNEPPGWSDLPVGWVGVFNKAVAYLDERLPGWEVMQVKQKFAALRLYFEPPEGTDLDESRRIHVAVGEILAESQRVCEICGQPGTLDEDNAYWWRTLCAEHRGSREEPQADLRWRVAPDGAT